MDEIGEAQIEDIPGLQEIRERLRYETPFRKCSFSIPRHHWCYEMHLLLNYGGFTG